MPHTSIYFVLLALCLGSPSTVPTPTPTPVPVPPPSPNTTGCTLVNTFPDNAGDCTSSTTGCCYGAGDPTFDPWIIDTGPLEVKCGTQGGWTAAQDNCWLDFVCTDAEFQSATIEYTFPTTIGNTYIFFAYVGDTLASPDTHPLFVSLNGEFVETIIVPKSYNQWYLRNYTFIATDTFSTIKLSSSLGFDEFGVFVDGIQIWDCNVTESPDACFFEYLSDDCVTTIYQQDLYFNMCNPIFTNTITPFASKNTPSSIVTYQNLDCSVITGAPGYGVCIDFLSGGSGKFVLGNCSAYVPPPTPTPTPTPSPTPTPTPSPTPTPTPTPSPTPISSPTPTPSKYFRFHIIFYSCVSRVFTNHKSLYTQTPRLG